MKFKFHLMGLMVLISGSVFAKPFMTCSLPYPESSLARSFKYDITILSKKKDANGNLDLKVKVTHYDFSNQRPKVYTSDSSWINTENLFNFNLCTNGRCIGSISGKLRNSGKFVAEYSKPTDNFDANRSLSCKLVK
jgi:hypothetical protein